MCEEPRRYFAQCLNIARASFCFFLGPYHFLFFLAGQASGKRVQHTHIVERFFHAALVFCFSREGERLAERQLKFQEDEMKGIKSGGRKSGSCNSVVF